MFDWLNDFLTTTPEEETRDRLHLEKLVQQQKHQIEQASLPENVFFEERIGTKENKESGQTTQHITLFLKTKKGRYDTTETMGKIMFTLYENVTLQEVFVMSNSMDIEVKGKRKKLVHVERNTIQSHYRGKGLSERIWERFFEKVQQEYHTVPISVEFINPVAEYTFRKALLKNQYNFLLDESLILKCYESDNDKTLEYLQKNVPSSG